jgi:hypothetical protein
MRIVHLFCILAIALLFFYQKQKGKHEKEELLTLVAIRLQYTRLTVKKCEEKITFDQINAENDKSELLHSILEMHKRFCEEKLGEERRLMILFKEIESISFLDAPYVRWLLKDFRIIYYFDMIAQAGLFASGLEDFQDSQSYGYGPRANQAGKYYQ